VPAAASAAVAATQFDTPASAALLSSLLEECHRFVTFHLTGLDEPVRVLSGVLHFETLCVQPNAQTFELFARLLRPMDLAPVDLTTVLTLLQLNLKRLSLARRQAAAQDECVVAVKAELLRTVTDIVFGTSRMFDVSIQSVALDTLLSGLEFFLATYGEQGRWLLDTVQRLLSLEASRAAPLLRLVSRRLSVDPIASYLLQPPCEVEASNNLNLVVVSSDGGGSNDMGVSQVLIDSASRFVFCFSSFFFSFLLRFFLRRVSYSYLSKCSHSTPWFCRLPSACLMFAFHLCPVGCHTFLSNCCRVVDEGSAQGLLTTQIPQYQFAVGLPDTRTDLSIALHYPGTR
jgi:hypothetical protein